MEKKSGFIWNTIGSLVYSFFNAIVLIFCTRINGTEISGIFSICYATGCIVNAIGDFGIRIFQVTDTKRKYKFGDYLFSRICSISLMMLISILFIFINRYSNEKLFICLILILIRVVDNFGETFQAEFQLRGRLDISGKALLYRNVIEIASFAIFDLITKNIYISFIAMLIASVIILLVYDFRLIIKCDEVKVKYNVKNVKEILKECTPLAISTLISMYVINAVKYAIDIYGNNTMQTYFNILYMPTFAINLISILIMKPFLKPFGEYWNSRNYKRFISTIIYIIVFLFISTILIEIVAILVGIPILSWLYKVNLVPYKIELFLLILSGLFYAISTVIFYALGTIRRQKKSTMAYTISAFFALISANVFVKKYELMGSAIASILIMVILLTILLVYFIVGYKLEKRNISNQIEESK